MVQPQETHRSPLRPVLGAYLTVTSATYYAKAGQHRIGVNRAWAANITLPTAQVRAGLVVPDSAAQVAIATVAQSHDPTKTLEGNVWDAKRK